jgi:hypothetical protein
LSGAVTKLASITFLRLAFSYWIDIPWFHNWGKTCCCAHHTFSWGFQLAGHLHQQHCAAKQAAAQRNFSWMDADWFRVFASEAIYRKKDDVRGHPGGPHHLVARPGGPAPPYGVASPWPSSVSALDFIFVSGKIGSLALVSSNSENIFCITFLKYKNSRK